MPGHPPSNRVETCQVERSRISPNGDKKGEQIASTPQLNLLSIQLSIFGLIDLQGHCIDHSGGLVTVIQCPLHLPHIALGLAQGIHRKDFPEAVHRDILRQPKRLGGPFHVPPYCLTCAVLIRPSGTLKDPHPPCLLSQLLEQRRSQIYPAPLPGLLLGDPELGLELIGPQLHHITNPQPGRDADPTHKPVCRCERCKNVLHLPMKKVFCCQICSTASISSSISRTTASSRRLACCINSAHSLRSRETNRSSTSSFSSTIYHPDKIQGPKGNPLGL